MKGTLFSADFVKDSIGNIKLLELNTDTSFIDSVLENHLDLSDFVNILSENSITTLHVIYKGMHQNFIDSLESYISTNATFITSFIKTEEDSNTIYPTVVEDVSDKFILRICYDENAVFDSKYAKSDINTLALFHTNLDSGSVIPLYHSSSLGEFNTLQTSFNTQNLPDFVVKGTTLGSSTLNFLKVGLSSSSSEERVSQLKTAVASDSNYIQNYLPTLNGNYTTSIRSFQIIYGTNLDLCYIAQYEIDSLLEIPTEIVFDDSIANNIVDAKHFFEFATNDFKEVDGLPVGTPLLSSNSSSINIDNVINGDSLISYFVSGSPDSDNTSIINAWSYAGSQLPSGSHESSSIVVNVNEDDNDKNILRKIIFTNGDALNIGGNTKLLSYNPTDDNIKFKNVRDLSIGDSLFNSSGNLVPIVSHSAIVYDDAQPTYMLNLEPIDTFIISGSTADSSITVVVHNGRAIFGCFTHDSQVEMFDGTMKNIVDVKIGDVVKSTYEGEIVGGTVTECLTHPVNKLVETTEYNGVVADRNHPVLFNGEWIPVSNLPFAQTTISYVENFYNLEIDGNKQESEHNYFIGGLPASGLGDNKELNNKYKRQAEELIKHL